MQDESRNLNAHAEALLYSWLMFYYPQRVMEIAQSQGHTQTTSLQHYINSPFTEEDKLMMRKYVDGW